MYFLVMKTKREKKIIKINQEAKTEIKLFRPILKTKCINFIDYILIVIC